jgi:hypothetical protein
MNPNGKCIGCHNPWGTLTSGSGDDAPDTDVEARHRPTEAWLEEMKIQGFENVQDKICVVWSSCPLSLGAAFFGALANRGIVEIDNCRDMFLAECVVKQLRNLVSHKLGVSADGFVAVHALTLGEEGLSLTLRYDSMLVLRDDECFVIHAY